MKYETKSTEQQAADRRDLDLLKRIDKARYFDEQQLTNKLIDIDTYKKVNKADRIFSMIRELELAKEPPMVGDFEVDHLKKYTSIFFKTFTILLGSCGIHQWKSIR